MYWSNQAGVSMVDSSMVDSSPIKDTEEGTCVVLETRL